MSKTHFEILKQRDDQLCKNLSKIIEKTKKANIAQITELTYRTLFNETHTLPTKQIATDELIKKICNNKSRIIQHFELLANKQTLLQVTHNSNSVNTDTVTIGSNRPFLSSEANIQLLSIAKEVLGAVDLKPQLHQPLAKEVRTFYEAREIELGRLTTLAHETQDFLLNTSVRLRTKYEEQHDQELANLHQRYEERKKLLEADIQKRIKELDNKEKALQARESKFDDRESRHVRREIRSDLKKLFAKHSESFNVTPGTRKLRHFTRAILWVLLIVTVVGLGLYTIESLQLTNAPLEQQLAIGIRQLLFGASFGTVSWFLIRWESSWAQRFADEEFRLKRMELDIDRSSWLVEMAMEWESERGAEIPAELISRLSAELFSSSDVKARAPDNAAEILAAAIFSQSSKVSLDVAGNQVEFDRKGMRSLQKIEP